MNPLNECASCGEDFTSVRLFDAHILNKASDPHFDCMQTDEMVAQGPVGLELDLGVPGPST